MRKFFILCVVVIIFLFTVGTVYSAVPAEEEKTKDLFEKRCSACHGIKRVTSIQKTPDEWNKTVQRMKAKKNSNITDEDAKTITDYLSKHYGKKR